jgi:hypothetical protein
MEKPTAEKAWRESKGAAIVLFLWFLIATSNAAGSVSGMEYFLFMSFYGAGEVGYILYVIHLWKTYFEALIDYKLWEFQVSGKIIQPVGSGDA